ncbi:MAG: hypothetical protein CL677_02035 [Bdellovibrionaceae bacterium]|nr:hypothetical protein [Pseudobdellovibrionaceae bacterium]|tara:strand:- start:5272 stop:5757 length:486 start_codon:yes stop_codon:yes gene_type:complete
MKAVASAMLIVLSIFGWNTWASDDGQTRNVAQYNLVDNTVGLKGFDPVSIFPEGGGVALEGDPELFLDFKGVVYYFANMENLNVFLEDPDKYEPTYGGWCATAMASGQKIDIQNDLYYINGRRAHYFVSADARTAFIENIRRLERRADRNWNRISGEAPRE